MLNAIIRFALQQRLLIITVAVLLMVYGAWVGSETEVDVFPDLNRPRVVVITEAPGYAPEEVERLITIPLETSLNGATGVLAVRSSSAAGISVVNVEFAWGTEIYTDRQIVTERLQLARERLPTGITPHLAPTSSIMGQIMMVGMWSDSDRTSPMEVRTLADWVVRQRLLSIPGVSQVFTMGGERRQFQVLIDPAELQRFGVSIEEVRHAVAESNENSSGGYLDEQGSYEILVRAVGRLQSIEELRQVVVTVRENTPVLLHQVAEIIEGAQTKRGDSSVHVRDSDGDFRGGPAVVLTINKQPGADTRQVTADAEQALRELQKSLPDDIAIHPNIYSQSRFIDLAIDNVKEALQDGAILVVIVLFVFLLNLRTTFITLTAIPLSLTLTAIVFHMMGLTVNTMTLGGLAVAIGELVDDAVVDVENIFRRLKLNRKLPNPIHPLRVVYDASREIRNSIVYGTLIVCLAFTPLFALSGMEGRLFTPLGIAYIVSVLASLLVSLTVTPVLSYWLLGRANLLERGENAFVSGLKRITALAIRFSLQFPAAVLGVTGVLVVASVITALNFERDFLPPFNEGSVQLNVMLPPGTSLRESNRIGRIVENRIKSIEEVIAFNRRTGRAELDEHAEGVHVSEFILTLDPESSRTRAEILKEIREAVADVPGTASSVEQPISHLISHMLSGVKAQVAIKVYGDDLTQLRRIAQKMHDEIESVAGVKDLMVEPLVDVPQLKIEFDRDRLMYYGLSLGHVNELIETAMNGIDVSTVIQQEQQFELVVRMRESDRENIELLRRLPVDLPTGGTVPLSAVAKIEDSMGPSSISREQVRRRIVVQCNVAGRGLVDVVEEIQSRLQPITEQLPTGYFVEYGGQFESQQTAARRITLLFVVSVLGIFALLFSMFRSVNLALQVMVAIPLALIGSVAALLWTGQTLTIAAMVGFISLGGIASRNGILLLNHYLHLVRYEGEDWTKEMIVRAGCERLSPVLMTALTSGIALIPLVLNAGEPGKEVLYPVATVVLGGLISSTLLDFLVHPALFWVFGIRSARRSLQQTESDLWDDPPGSRPSGTEPTDEKPMPGT